MYRLRSTEIFHHAENALPQRGEHAAEHADVLCFAKLHAVRRGKVDVIDLRGAWLVHARGGSRRLDRFEIKGALVLREQRDVLGVERLELLLHRHHVGGNARELRVAHQHDHDHRGQRGKAELSNSLLNSSSKL